MFQVKYFLSYEYLTTQTQAKQSNISCNISCSRKQILMYRGGSFVVNQKSVFLSKASKLISYLIPHGNPIRGFRNAKAAEQFASEVQRRETSLVWNSIKMERPNANRRKRKSAKSVIRMVLRLLDSLVLRLPMFFCSV